MFWMTAFSEWLNQIMSDRELGIRQLATYSKVTHSTIRLWRLGATTPSYENCEHLANALHVDVGLVRALAGYTPDGTPASELTPEEQSLVQTWRTANAEGRRLLLATAEVLAGTLTAPDASAPRPARPRKPRS